MNYKELKDLAYRCLAAAELLRCEIAETAGDRSLLFSRLLDQSTGRIEAFLDLIEKEERNAGIN